MLSLLTLINSGENLRKYFKIRSCAFFLHVLKSKKMKVVVNMERNARPPPLQRCSPGTKPISQNRPICFIFTVVLGGTFEFSEQHLLEKVFCVSFWNTFLESSPNSIDHFGQVETDLLDIFWGHFFGLFPE